MLLHEDIAKLEKFGDIHINLISIENNKKGLTNLKPYYYSNIRNQK